MLAARLRTSTNGTNSIQEPTSVPFEMGSHLRGVQPTSNICANEKTGSMALKDVLVDELSDMYSAENRLVKALPNLAEGAIRAQH